MLLQWNKFAQKMVDSGKRLMATYMQMNDPTLNGTKITLELPNQSTKEEFLSGSIELLGYLRGKLHNHDITIEVVVNETTENKSRLKGDANCPRRQIDLSSQYHVWSD